MAGVAQQKRQHPADRPLHHNSLFKAVLGMAGSQYVGGGGVGAEVSSNAASARATLSLPPVMTRVASEGTGSTVLSSALLQAQEQQHGRCNSSR